MHELPNRSTFLRPEPPSHPLKDKPLPSLNINGQDTAVDADLSIPILWALRDTLGMTATKFGCGAALCGACTVHLDGAATRSCVTPISAAVGKKITTIEAVGSDKVGQAVQTAWVAHDVAQCGYCQSGQVMSDRAAQNQQETHRRGYRRGDGWLHLPLRHLRPRAQRDPRCCPDPGLNQEVTIMHFNPAFGDLANQLPKGLVARMQQAQAAPETIADRELPRRTFLKLSVASGFALGAYPLIAGAQGAPAAADGLKPAPNQFFSNIFVVPVDWPDCHASPW
jgi:isoquinoline 1-oxidoreductase alpha subunit